MFTSPALDDKPAPTKTPGEGGLWMTLATSPDAAVLLQVIDQDDQAPVAAMKEAAIRLGNADFCIRTFRVLASMTEAADDWRRLFENVDGGRPWGYQSWLTSTLDLRKSDALPAECLPGLIALADHVVLRKATGDASWPENASIAFESGLLTEKALKKLMRSKRPSVIRTIAGSAHLYPGQIDPEAALLRAFETDPDGWHRIPEITATACETLIRAIPKSDIDPKSPEVVSALWVGITKLSQSSSLTERETIELAKVLIKNCATKRFHITAILRQLDDEAALINYADAHLSA